MTLTAAARRALTIEHQSIPWSRAIRGAVVTAAVVTVCVGTGHRDFALYAGIGALFTGIAILGDTTTRRRAQGILVALSLALGTLLGSIVQPDTGWNLALFGALALVAGFTAAIGRAAALLGTVFLANYAVSVGLPHAPGSILPATLALLGGALVQVAATELWDLARRLRLDPAAAHAMTRRAILRQHLHWHDPFVWHALRLAIAEVSAMALGSALGISHGYWIPLTVAFILVPGTEGTATQVIGRILGTLLGLALLVSGVFAGLGGEWAAIAAIGIGALVSFAFGPENYAFSVTGTTIAVLVLDSFVGQAVMSNVPLRIECTLWAAAIAIAAWLLTAPWRIWIRSAP